MAADKQTKLLAKQLFKLSVVNGVVSPEQVAGVLGWVEKLNTRRPVAASAKPNPKLLAGLRVRVGSDVYESTVAGQLATLSV